LRYGDASSGDSGTCCVFHGDEQRALGILSGEAGREQ
jgi:hypothetical protein